MSDPNKKELQIVEASNVPGMEINRVIEEVESFKQEDKSQDKVVELMKSLTHMVKNFKMKALLLEAEQESLLSMLNSLRDVSSVNVGTPEGAVTDLIDSLTSAMTNVDVKISTIRTKNEEEALHQVNGIISQLVLKVQEDLNSTKETCEAFLKSSYADGTETTQKITAGDSSNDIAARFELTIAKCSEDDQQRIKRRLCGLLNYMKSLQSQLDQCSLEEI